MALSWLQASPLPPLFPGPRKVRSGRDVRRGAAAEWVLPPPGARREGAVRKLERAVNTSREPAQTPGCVQGRTTWQGKERTTQGRSPCNIPCIPQQNNKATSEQGKGQSEQHTGLEKGRSEQHAGLRRQNRP